MVAEALINVYKNSGKEIARINEESDVKMEELSNQKHKLMKGIWDREDKIRDDTRLIEDKYEDDKHSLTEDTAEQIAPHAQHIEHVKRIVEFLEVQERGINLEMKCNDRIKEGYFREWQEWIHNDDYLKIRLKITENDKPVNKYTVSSVIKCVFYEPLIKLPDLWGGLEHGSFKTVDDAKAFIVKKKGKLFLDEIEKVEALKAEYLDIIGKYKLSYFEELFEYRCSTCSAVFKNKIPEYHEAEVVVGFGTPEITRQMKECIPERGFYRTIV